MTWDTSRPKNSDYLKDAAAEWRSTKSDLDNYLQSMVYWSDSAASAGEPRLSGSTAAPSTGRIFAIPRSDISSRGRADLYYATDEQRLVYMDSSGNSIAIGGTKAMVSWHTLDGSSRNLPMQDYNTKTVICSSSATTVNDNILIANVTYGVTYGAPPQVFVTSSSTQGASSASYLVAVTNVTTSTCSLTAQYAKASSGTVNDIRWFWRSIGTVTV
jgi:hypothetical protein